MGAQDTDILRRYVHEIYKARIFGRRGACRKAEQRAKELREQHHFYTRIKTKIEIPDGLVYVLEAAQNKNDLFIPPLHWHIAVFVPHFVSEEEADDE